MIFLTTYGGDVTCVFLMCNRFVAAVLNKCYRGCAVNFSVRGDGLPQADAALQIKQFESRRAGGNQMVEHRRYQAIGVLPPKRFDIAGSPS